MALTKITTDSIDLSADTTALKIPKGTTAERPAGGSSTTGQIRENTDTGNVEVYNGSAWRALQQTGQDVDIVPTNNFNTVLYEGNGTTKSITGLNFQPDLTWVKDRDAANDNLLVDSVNGAGSAKGLVSNATYLEGAYTAGYGYISSLNTNGFTVSQGSSAPFYASYTNVLNDDYVSWSWKAGGNSNTFNIDGTGYTTAAAAGMNAGSISPTKCSVNTEAGFSIINYDGDGGPDDISHGLTSAPEFVIIKSMSNAEGWLAWPKYGTTSYTYELSLNSDAAEYNSAGNMFAGDTTASLIFLGTDGWVNGTGQEYICYAWHSVPNYSLIGSYTGTSSTTNVPKIYTGFLPAWIMVKRTDYAGDWNIVDNKRSTSNPRDLELFANTNVVEATANYVNFNDDGFQIQTTDADWNASGGEYIFMCFAS